MLPIIHALSLVLRFAAMVSFFACGLLDSEQSRWWFVASAMFGISLGCTVYSFIDHRRRKRES